MSPLQVGLRPLLWALAFGLLTGALHAAVVTWQHAVAGKFAWFSREFVWMAPLGYAMLFVGVAAPLALGSMAWPRLGDPRVLTWVFAALSVFGLLLPYSEIATWASLLLAAGTATQLARAARGREAGVRRLLVTTSGVLLVGCTVAALLMAWGRPRREREALASLGAAPQGAPNVLLIILDTVRAASLSLYGHPLPTTPRLEVWAREGVVFDYAIAPAPWTLPTHASIMTGLPAAALSAQWVQPLDRSQGTLAEALRERGYATAGIVANHAYTAYDSGLERGFLHYEDYLVSFRQVIRSTSFTQTALFNSIRAAGSSADIWRAIRKFDLSIEAKHTSQRRTAELVTQHFLEWQASVGSRPFFAFLNYYDAHLPYYAPPGFAPVNRGAGSRAAYENAIAWLDQNVDQVFTTLKDRGVLDNTIVIVTSDHGELFQEFGLSGHAHNVYQNTVRVPLLVRYPSRVPAGVRVAREVSLRDLAATVGDLGGFSNWSMPGRSLGPVMRGDTTSSSMALSEVERAPNVPAEFPTASGSLTTVFDSIYQFITSTAGREQLFVYRDTSRSTVDVASDTALSGVVSALRTRASAARTGPQGTKR